MNFIFKMAWRDSRASRRRLLFYASSIVFGIAAIVTLGSFSASLEGSVHAQARGLVGSDLVITGRAPPSDALSRRLAALGGEEAHQVVFSSMMVFSRAPGATRLVQVHAMEGDFPFYGEFVTEPAGAAAALRRAASSGAEDRIVVLEEPLMSQFGLKPGDAVKLGRATFTVAGAIRKIPGEGPEVVLFAPRALIPMSSLAATGLASATPLVRFRTELKLPPGGDPDAIARSLRDEFAEERLSFETAGSRERDLGRVISNIFEFLGLVGFVALLLGAIGVASAVHVYVRRKVATVALLRCLGASARRSFSIYLVQGVGLGGIGAVAGAGLGLLAQAAIPILLKSWLPVAVDFSISWHAVIRGMAAGWSICALFSLLPLMPLRRTPPLAALRSSADAAGGARFDAGQWMVGGCIMIAVSLFAVSQARSVTRGLGFTAMLCLSAGVLAGLAWIVAWAARRAVSPRLPYVLRQGLANLHRPDNRTVQLLVSVGLGAGLILTLILARATLLREIGNVGGSGRPNLLLFDIEGDQIGPLAGKMAAEGAPLADQAPVVTMTIAFLKGRSAAELLKDPSVRIPSWLLRREFRSTYRSALTGSERVVSGRFVGRIDPSASVVPISVEEGFAKDLGLSLGDTIDWNVQGAPIRTRVSSIRSVEWRRLEPNFFVVFPAGVLESAPQFYMAALHTGGPADSARIQSSVVAAFPNVSAVDFTLIRRALDEIFSKASFVLAFMSLLTVATGLQVLAGAVMAGSDQRARETVLLRTLGASRAQLAGIQAVEYAALGGLAALVGGALAFAANGLLASRVFHVEAAVPLLAPAAILAAIPVLTLVTGRIADRGLALRTPLDSLRRI